MSHDETEGAGGPPPSDEAPWAIAPRAAVQRFAAWYLVADLLSTTTNTLLLLPLYTHFLAPADYGALKTLSSAALVLPTFTSLGLSSAFVAFYFRYRPDRIAFRRFCSTFFWFIAGWGLLVTAIGSFAISEAFGRDIGLPFWPYYPLAAIAPLFQQLGAIGASHGQQQLQAPRVALISTLAFALGTATSLALLVGLSLGSRAILVGAAVNALVCCVAYTVLLAREGALGLTFDATVLREALAFSLPTVPAFLCAWVTLITDRLLLAIYGTTSAVGIYVVGFELGRLLTRFVEAVANAYSPLLYAAMAADERRGREQLERFLPYYVHLLMGAALFLSLLAPEAVALLTDVRYHEAWRVTPVVALGCFCGGLYKPFSVILAHHRRTVYTTVGSFLQAFVSVGLNLLLVPRFGAAGASWGFVGATVVYTAWIVVGARRLVPVAIRWREVAWSLWLVAAVLVAWALASPCLDGTLAPLAYKVALAGAALAVSRFLPVYDRSAGA